jgi:hypothetical protein
MAVVLDNHVMLSPFQHAALLAPGYTFAAAEYDTMNASDSSDGLKIMTSQ